MEGKLTSSIDSSPNPDSEGLLRILAVLVTLTGIILLALQIAMPGKHVGPGALIATGTGAAMLYLVHIHRLRWAALLFCWCIMVAAWLGGYDTLGLMDNGWIAMPIATMAGGWLLGRKAAVLLAVAGTASVLAMLWLHLQGHVFSQNHILLSAAVIYIAAIAVSTLIGIASASSFRAKLNELAESRAHLTAIFDSTDDMIWAVDPYNFGLLTFNTGLRDYIQLRHGTHIEPEMRPEAIFTSNDLVEQWRKLYARALQEGSFSCEYIPSTGTNTLLLSFNLMRRDGEVFAISVFAKDITERKNAEARIEHLAYHDQLTGLPNRVLFVDRLGQALAAAQRAQRYGAMMFVDLDQFKRINDLYGHALGDKVLQDVAQRLHFYLRQGDTVARFGGDEFVVLLPELSSSPEAAATLALAVGEKLHAALEQPAHIDGQEYRTAACIGITLFPKRDESAEDLMREADIAMYRAKESGRNKLTFFEHDMQTVIAERYALERELRDALQHGGLELYLQSQVDASGVVIGAEALVRWRHPTRGLVLPATFIPVAEETGLIVDVGEWVLRNACSVITQLTASNRSLRIAVNVSPGQFRQEAFVARVRQILGETGADPVYLTLEITENLLIEQASDVVAHMLALSDLGIRFAIDDFGTGYSSLVYLKRLPLHELKIDKSFVQDVPHDANDVVLVETILAMARHLGLEVVAEGVETAAQMAFLKTQGCKYFQGYLFHRPEPQQSWLSRLGA